MKKPFSFWAWAVVFYNIAVILWGAYVRASGSGAGCGSHWPLCNGEVLPAAQQVKTMIEFSHRLTSGLSLIFVFALGIAAFRGFSKGTFVRKAAAASMIAIVLEALIGAGLVLLRLVEHDQSIARAVSISLHLVNTSFLMGALTLTALAAREENPVTYFWPIHLKIRRESLVILGGFLFLGCSGAITALGDTLFRPQSFAEGFQREWSAGAHFLERLRIVHPFLAVGWACMVIPWSMGLEDRIQCAPHARPWIKSLVGGVAFNLGLGLLNVVLLAPTSIQMIHLLAASFIWIALMGVLSQVEVK